MKTNILNILVIAATSVVSGCATVSNAPTKSPALAAAGAEVDKAIQGITYSSSSALAMSYNIRLKPGLPQQSSQVNKTQGHYTGARVNANRQLVITSTEKSSYFVGGQLNSAATSFFTDVANFDGLKVGGISEFGSKGRTSSHRDAIASSESEDIDGYFNLHLNGTTLRKQNVLITYPFAGQLTENPYQGSGALIIHSDSRASLEKLRAAILHLVDTARTSS
jgi:hypothetical protein